MPPVSRFGASKYRNATPYLNNREEWYRTLLPPTSSGTSSSLSALSTFSSEIKVNRTHIVTLTHSGVLTSRKYDDVADENGVEELLYGTSMGDWDVSPLEGGQVALGTTDGRLFSHTLRSPSSSNNKADKIASSPITHVVYHPTTPSLLLVSTVATPIAIYDTTCSPPKISLELHATEPKGLWTVAWSPDGRKVAAVGRSGTAYVFTPRSSLEPTVSRSLPLQPLKPCRVAFVGDDLFVTSFSRMRNREYHLFSGTDLSTIFTQTLDTSPGLLIPLVDQERKIIYAAGRGDMSVRQIELSGPQGYQETLHPLPSPVASNSLAMAHPATLPVMSAQIATILVPLVDKDGDTIAPLGVRVPRRQLIDYHDDLYPEIMGTIPEQTAQEWLEGGDKAPTLISLDPTRRAAWEKRAEELVPKSPVPSDESASDQLRPDDIETQPQAQSSSTPNARPADAAVPVVPSAPIESASRSPVPAAPERNTKKDSVPTDAGMVAFTSESPPLRDAETYVSTAYKARIMAQHIDGQLQRHRAEKKQGPLMVGLQGPQGCGKTTLCKELLSVLQNSPRNLRVAVLSLDDLYKTNQGLKDVASRHPDNKLLAGRGPPGTHDTELTARVLDAIQTIKDGETVELPIFDKSLCSGEGDRSEAVVKVVGPLDVFILEGWSMGFGALSAEELKSRYDAGSSLSDTKYFPSHPLSSLETLNEYLAEFAATACKPFTTIVQIEPESYRHVFEWRLEQERNMKAANGGKGMTDEQVEKFVERYMPGYELWKAGIWTYDQPWAGAALRLWFDKERRMVSVDTSVPKSNQAQSATESRQPGDQLDHSVSHPTGDSSKVDRATNGVAPAAQDAEPSAAVSSETRTRGLAALDTEAPTSKQGAGDASSVKARFNPNWSRKFLAGKAPLIPTYDQVPSLSTLHQDSQVLKATSKLVFFPIQGPGGRIGVHPLSKKGRMATGGEGYLSGGVEVTDFAVEPFEGDGTTTRVALAGEDGVVRVWAVGAEGVQGAGPEPDLVLKGSSIDKIAQIMFHPTARDLLVIATNDSGTAHVRFFSLATSKEELVVPLDAPGVFNIAWSADGSRLATATKDGKIVILDPRDKSTVASGKAHDSPRSFQMAWIDDRHLISVGFSRGSQRRINLYKVGTTTSSVETVHSLLIDVSPSVLFPVFDPDTSILYVWGKGERQIQAYEVHPENGTEPIAKLPSYTAGSPQLGLAFFPKATLDVRKVEVAKVLRLTAKTIEEVTYTIPRNKPDFFQDDIYVDTANVQCASTTAVEWLEGARPPLERVSLQPDGMKPLSEAPQTTTKAKTKFVPAKDVLSEAEKKQREMDALFAKAKMGDSSDDDDDEPPRTGLAPPDDDW